MQCVESMFSVRLARTGSDVRLQTIQRVIPVPKALEGGEGLGISYRVWG